MRILISMALLALVSVASADAFRGKAAYAPTFRPANPPNTIGVPAQNQNLRNRDAKDLYLRKPGTQFATTPRDQYRWRPTTRSDRYWLDNRDNKRRNGCCPERELRR